MRFFIPLILAFIGIDCVAQTPYSVRPANYCRQIPAFVRTVGFTSSAALSTSDTRLKGLVLIEGGDPKTQKKYQHPSWSKSGWMAPIHLTEKGDVLMGAVPVVNTLYNPIEKQNAIYKVDGVTQELTTYINIQSPYPANEQNPFGVLGIAYNCNDQSIFTSSVFGSSRSQERGQIVRIDKNKKQTTVLANKDVIGLSLVTEKEGLRLYYGLAREPEIWSVGINAKGEAEGAPRLEIDLENLGARGDDRARRINFMNNGTMIVWGVHFHFNLIAPTEKLETIYHFARDEKQGDKWTFQRIEASGLRQ